MHPEGPSLEYTTLGRSWGALCRSWAALGALLATLGALLGALIAALGALLAFLEALLGRSRPLLGGSWLLWGHSWLHLGYSRGIQNAPQRLKKPKYGPKRSQQDRLNKSARSPKTRQEGSKYLSKDATLLPGINVLGL